jgi:hypothetical protein
VLGLGTYGDGVNRQRPMLIFANPLGAAQLDRHCTWVTALPPTAVDSRFGHVYEIGRSIPEGGQGIFHAYRAQDDIPSQWEPQLLVDPFPKPIRRVVTTQSRGKFRLPISVRDAAQGDSGANS